MFSRYFEWAATKPKGVPAHSQQNGMCRNIENFFNLYREKFTQEIFQLQIWLDNPKQQLLVENALSAIETPYNSDPMLVRRIHAFLERYGFINFGVFKRLRVRISISYFWYPHFCKVNNYSSF